MRSVCDLRVREIKEPNAWVKFRLLMWKNFLIQWRQRRQTVMETLLPVFTMALVLLVRMSFEPVQNQDLSYQSFPSHTLFHSRWVLQGMDVNNLYIAYSPKSPVLEEIMSTVAVKFIALNLDTVTEYMLKGAMEKPKTLILRHNYWIPEGKILQNQTNLRLNLDLTKLVKVKSFSRAALLNGIYIKEKTTQQVIAAVQFSDQLSGATELTSNLEFSLRFPHRPRLNSFYGNGGNSWHTDRSFPIFEFPGPRWPYSWSGGNDPGYLDEMFITLQDLVSNELVAKLTGSNLDSYAVNTRRFPHPAFVDDGCIEILKNLLPLFFMMSYSYTAANLVRAITVEKELQLKETMKIMGLPTWLHWTAWFWKQYLYLMISAILIVILLKVHWFKTKEGFEAFAVFTHTPWTILLFFLSMFLATMIFFCFFLTSFFSTGSTAALFTGIIWFILYIPSFLFAMGAAMSPATQAFTCLSVVTAMAYGFQMLLTKESVGGMKWGDFFYIPGDDAQFVFGHVILMMIFDCILFMLLTLYLEQVMPGPFGSPKPWNFFLKKHYWLSARTKKYEASTINVQNMTEEANQNVVNEGDPTDLPVGAALQNLTKVYGVNTVVDNLSFNIYDDQITVLLGHNGAGKSTTISMLTGNVQPTHGSIMVAGYDMINNAHAARAYVGLCPQHNVLFDLMTVMEHLEFFARLKGLTGADLKDELAVMIKKLELEDKSNYLSQGLSGGQKRRLAVGIALCGGAKVVLLDEPTSGMDPSSRRALWDLLQQEKKGRSMILTTHFMDEADILGDRVAIMANGRLQCVGTPFFLKNHYGVGYTLVVAKKKGFNTEACTQLINNHVPDTTIKEDRGTEVTYSLLNQHSDKFQSLLSDLESQKDNIHYQAYGLEATTLEDVFMSAGADLVPTKANEEDEHIVGPATIESLVGEENRNIKGWPLLKNHVIAIWFKLWLIWMRNWPAVLLQILVPLLIMNAVFGVIQYVMDTSGDKLESRELSITKGYHSTETILSFNGSGTTQAYYDAYKKNFAAMGSKLTAIGDKEDISDYYMIRASDEKHYNKIRHELLIGATFTDDSATSWYSNFGFHDAANSLSHLYQAILKEKMPDASLTIYNHPLKASYADNSDLELLLGFLTVQLCFGLGSAMAIVSAVFIMFYIKERLCRAKLLQKAAGVRPITLWFSAAVFDWAWFVIICAPIFISCSFFDIAGLSSSTELARLCLCLMMYGAAMLPLTYLCSSIFASPASGFVSMFFVNLLLGMLAPEIVNTLWKANSKSVPNFMDAILQFFPLYSLITCVRFLNTVGLTEWSCYQSCDYLKVAMPDLTNCTMKVLCGIFPDTCCEMVNFSIWRWKKPGILRYFLCMLLMCVVFWLLLMVAEYRLLQKYFTPKKSPPSINESTLDDDVVAETRKVDTLLSTQDQNQEQEQSLIASQLTKYYKDHLAVNQVSFTVEDKQCFGLLGVNGAGKTTTFKMLMGDELISSGDAFVSGHSVKKDINNVYKHIGYCPQFEAIFGEFTGRETLKFFSMLRGLPPDVASARTDVLADALGFKRHLDKRVDHYSGGNKRKLSTAVALLGDTRLVFVDEPTTGVDPAAKRQMWTAIQSAQRSGRGIVLTSHSMEECEALCTRLTIMVNGQFQCIGAPQHLKYKFSEGYTLTVKMKTDDKATKSQIEMKKSDSDINKSQTNRSQIETSRSQIEANKSQLGIKKSQMLKQVDSLKEFVNTHFKKAKLMEEYQGLLTYYLPDRSMTWSEIFGIMEKAKDELNIEDYKIAQTTLEQIFLQFTKYQKQEA